jgi:ferredoxin, 2Fe-2S
MPRVTLYQGSGESLSIEIPLGNTLMQAAVTHLVPGILAECGGGLACGTCHVRVDAAWLDRLPGMDEMEHDMIDALENAGEGSRLACQIGITQALDGMIVQVQPP